MSSSSLKSWTVLVLGVVLAGATYWWFATIMDRHEDHPRVMYRNVLRMAELQTRELHQHRPVVPVELDHSEHVRLGGTKFRPARGVRIQVKTHGADGYCVKGWNQYGDSTNWLCGDATNTP